MEERNIARKSWNNTGLTYKDIKRIDIEKLKQLIKYELQTYLPTTEHSRSMDMRLAIELKKDLKFNKNEELVYGGIFIAGSYFDHREGIYFNDDGFISFCGWADSENKIPIIKAFNEWINYMVNKQLNYALKEE